MTNPAAAITINGERHYVLEPIPNDPVPSVSVVLSRIAAAWSLQLWKDKNLVRTIVRDPGLLALAEVEGTLYDAIDGARRRGDQTGANFGTAGHEIARAIEAGVPAEQLRSPSMAWFVDKYMALRAEIGWRCVRSEYSVGNVTYRYGGTVDAATVMPHEGLIVCDVKTGKSLYPREVLQVAAYANAELAVDGTELPPVRKDIGALIHVPREGKPSVRIVDLREAWSVFRCLRYLDEFLRREPDVWRSTYALGSTDLEGLLARSIQQVNERKGA